MDEFEGLLVGERDRDPTGGPVRLLRGTVTAVATSKVTVSLSGSAYEADCLNFAPAVDDRVSVLDANGTYLVLGKLR